MLLTWALQVKNDNGDGSPGEKREVVAVLVKEWAR
jgi:hypothetical protein